MKSKIVLVPFPCDDLATHKARPAVCLTDEIRPQNHVVVAVITSPVPSTPSATDLIIDDEHSDFATILG